jgi:hypothetical protein
MAETLAGLDAEDQARLATLLTRVRANLARPIEQQRPGAAQASAR